MSLLRLNCCFEILEIRISQKIVRLREHENNRKCPNSFIFGKCIKNRKINNFFVILRNNLTFGKYFFVNMSNLTGRADR